MHQRLGLGGPGIEDAAGLPEDLENVGVVGALVIPPADEAGVEAFPFHADVFFDADWEAMERAHCAFVFLIKVVKVFGSLQGFFG